MPPATADASAPQSTGQAPDTTDNGAFVFKTTVDEVVLHATVFDEKQRFVTNLDKNAFTVYEDGRPADDHLVSQGRHSGFDGDRG